MKKMLVATLICASCVSTAMSQESRKVVNAEPQHQRAICICAENE